MTRRFVVAYVLAAAAVAVGCGLMAFEYWHAHGESRFVAAMHAVATGSMVGSVLACAFVVLNTRATARAPRGSRPLTLRLAVEVWPVAGGRYRYRLRRGGAVLAESPGDYPTDMAATAAARDAAMGYAASACSAGGYDWIHLDYEEMTTRRDDRGDCRCPVDGEAP